MAWSPSALSFQNYQSTQESRRKFCWYLLLNSSILASNRCDWQLQECMVSHACVIWFPLIGWAEVRYGRYIWRSKHAVITITFWTRYTSCRKRKWIYPLPNNHPLKPIFSSECSLTDLKLSAFMLITNQQISYHKIWRMFIHRVLQTHESLDGFPSCTSHVMLSLLIESHISVHSDSTPLPRFSSSNSAHPNIWSCIEPNSRALAGHTSWSLQAHQSNWCPRS